jgi:predicted N-acetyltransferase YhbS
MNGNYAYRTEIADDYEKAECLTRDAFWDLYKPGCDEACMLHRMRADASFVRDLAVVCETAGESGAKPRIVGAVYCVECLIIDGETEYATVCVGPLAVASDCRRRGIGMRLLSIVLERAKNLGYSGAILFGNPAYYGKSGFRQASLFGVHLPDGTDIPEFMCAPLDAERFSRVRGIFRMNPVFLVDGADLAEYEKKFPPREKHVLSGQFFGDREGGAK